LRKDSASKIPAIRFKEKARFKDKIAAAEPTSVYAVDEHASHLGTQFNGRTYNRPETHSPRADCARFMPRFRYLRLPPACAGALSAPRQGGVVKWCSPSSPVEPSERERERDASATRHCEPPNHWVNERWPPSEMHEGTTGLHCRLPAGKSLVTGCTSCAALPKATSKSKTIRKETLGLQMPRPHA